MPAGTILIRAGERPRAVYILLEGKLTAHTERLRDEPVGVLSVGEIAGEMSFLERRPAVATVRAERDSVVLAIPPGELENRMRADSEFSARFHRALALMLSGRLQTTMTRLGRAPGASNDERREDDLAEISLDSVQMGALRFHRILELLSGQGDGGHGH